MATKSPLILGDNGYPSRLQSGDTLSVSSLGTGTADSTKYLRGDGTWNTISVGNAIVEEVFSPTNGQTTFTISGGYTVGAIKVNVNGIELFPVEYTASNGTTVVLSESVQSSDVVKVTKFNTLAVGTTSIVNDVITNATYYPLFATGTGTTIANLTTANTKLTFNPNTGVLSATGLNSLSDESLKKDIQTIRNPIDKIKNLRGVTYTWKSNNQKSLGLIAQEVEQVIPEVVAKCDNIKTVGYGQLVGLLIEAIKNQQEEIDVLKMNMEEIIKRIQK